MIDISTLTRQEQEALYEQLRVALGLLREEPPPEPAIPDWHWAILDQRLAEMEDDDTIGVPASVVFAELRRRHRDRS